MFALTQEDLGLLGILLGARPGFVKVMVWLGIEPVARKGACLTSWWVEYN